MIAEIIPDAYEFFGTKISKPSGKRNRVFYPTFPIGRYLSQALLENFNDINELREFLSFSSSQLIDSRKTRNYTASL
ncbi:MAG: hypothetical protein P8X55_10965 [Desulfosarcinaceae bacterium]